MKAEATEWQYVITDGENERVKASGFIYDTAAAALGDGRKYVERNRPKNQTWQVATSYQTQKD